MHVPYLQRAGRAGRRSEGRSIAYTLCKADPHNQRAFAQPKWPFVTAIPAPHITLSSARIVQRHVNSLLLATFLRQTTDERGDRTRLKLLWFFGGGDDAACRRFIAWMQASASDFEASVRLLVGGTALAGRSMASVTAAAVDTLTDIEARWREDHERLLQQLGAAEEPAYKKALELEKKRHEDEYLLRELATRAFLPTHGFPTHVVGLNTYNIEEFIHAQQPRREGREDSLFNHKEQPSRGLDIAIREYAPGAQVVIDGRVYRSAGISLQWHTMGERKEAQKFDISWRCGDCGAAGVADNAYSRGGELCCTHCGAPPAALEQKMVLRPYGFTTDFYESTSNDVTTQKYIRVERPRVQLVGETLSLPDNRCGHLRFGHEGSVFYHSAGEHDHGYAVCLTCGRADSMMETGELPKDLRPDRDHRPVGGLSGSRRDKDCSGVAVKANVYLGYHIKTDVLELFLKSPNTGEWLSDRNEDQVIATTLAVALRDAIADHLGISATEMGFGCRLDKELASGQGRSVVQIFDQVSGGAGFALAGLGDVVGLLNKAAAKLECPVSCDNVCSHCLAGQDSRVEYEELDRRAARAWFADSGVLARLDLPSAFTGVPGATYCSVGPGHEIRAAINEVASGGGDRPVLQLALNRECRDWDLAHGAFRDSVLTWQVVDKVDVRLGLPAALPEALKRDLAVLTRLGVTVFELDQRWAQYGTPMIAQVVGNGMTRSLFATDDSANCPGEHWLAPAPTGVFASTQRVDPMLCPALDTEDWGGAEAGARVLEISSELSGPTNGLKNRLQRLVAEQAPELQRLLDNDQAVAISYSDRYLKSPWSLMLLTGFAALFGGERLGRVTLQTLEPAAQPGRPSLLVDHDWQHAEDLEAVVSSWLGGVLGVAPTVELLRHSRDLQHGRVLTVEWASGVQSRLILDQGMGYWAPRFPRRYQREFDFHQPSEGQTAQMLESFGLAEMTPAGDWPTYITVVAS